MGRESFKQHLQDLLNTTQLLQVTPRGTKDFVIQTGKLLNVVDRYQDPRFDKTRRMTFADPKTRARAIMVCPVISKRSNEVIGLVEVINKTCSISGEQRQFDSSDERLVQMICSHVSNIIDTICDDDKDVIEFLERD